MEVKSNSIFPQIKPTLSKTETTEASELHLGIYEQL